MPAILAAEDRVTLTVELPSGPVEVSAAYERPHDPWATVVVAHGAGTTYNHPMLAGFTRALGAAGVAAMRFNFAYSEAGRRMPGPASHAMAAWSAVMTWAGTHADGTHVWAAGRSYGGRMASMAAADGVIDPAGLVYLGYPLHPPGRPDLPRTAHLPSVAAPQLFISGDADPFVDPHEPFEAAVASCQNATLRWVEGGHSFEIKGRKRPADAIGADLAPLVLEFIRARR